MALPLSNIKVVDFSQALAAPFSGMLLADQGADVIKVEPPDGDSSRSRAPNYGGTSITTLSFNRNKRSIVADITKPAGLEVAYRLIKWADVLVTNTRVDARRRRGLSYEAVAGMNPRLVYASLTGYGEKGPDANLPGADITIQARVGDIAGRRPVGGSYPSYTHLYHFDMAAGIVIAYSVMVALYEREHTGRGQKIEINLLQAGLALHSVQMTRRAGTSERYAIRPPGLPNQYMCSDGRQLLSQSINIGPRWEGFTKSVGLDKLLADPAFDTLEKRERSVEKLQGIIARHFATRPAAEWEAMFKRENLSATVVKEIETEEVDNDTQVVANKMIIKFEQPGLGTITANSIPFHLPAHDKEQWLRRPAPKLGEHTDEVLKELGYSPKEIESLKASGGIG
ncbi:MAG: CoA transferase [Chloroflexota bacterium]